MTLLAALDEMDIRDKRIVVHIGTPKTGTSALQSCLGSNNDLLARAGWYYPPSFSARATREVRHQVLVTDLVNGALADSVPLLHDIRDSAAPNVFLSSEGFYTNLPRIETRLHAFLRHLGRHATIEVSCVFRPKRDFLRSLYRQFVKAGPWHTLPLSGYGGSLESFEAEPDIRFLLDYEGIAERFAAAGITFRQLAYGPDIIAEYESLYFGATLDRGKVFANSSDSDEICELLRLCNLAGATFNDKLSLLLLLGERQLPAAEAHRLGAILQKILDPGPRRFDTELQAGARRELERACARCDALSWTGTPKPVDPAGRP